MNGDGYRLGYAELTPDTGSPSSVFTGRSFMGGCLSADFDNARFFSEEIPDEIGGEIPIGGEFNDGVMALTRVEHTNALSAIERSAFLTPLPIGPSKARLTAHFTRPSI